jgi:hypothetical protein
MVFGFISTNVHLPMKSETSEARSWRGELDAPV